MTIKAFARPRRADGSEVHIDAGSARVQCAATESLSLKLE